MEVARFEDSSGPCAPYNGYKTFCPPAWIISTQSCQDRNGDVTMSDADGSASPLEPSSSDTFIVPPLLSSSSTIQETANDVAQVSAPTNVESKDRQPSASRVSISSSPSSKISLRSKLKGILRFRSGIGSKSKGLSGQPTVDTSPNLATQKMNIDGNDNTTETFVPTIKQFRWPMFTSPAVDAGTVSTDHPKSSTAGLKFQPKQSPPQIPKTYSAVLATASSQPPPPKASSAFSAAALSAQGPPPAPSVSANNPRSMYNAMGQSDSAVSRSANLISPSGYSTSTTTDLADVPSRLPYQSPGYSPDYRAS